MSERDPDLPVPPGRRRLEGNPDLSDPEQFGFGEFELDVRQRELRRAGKRVAIQAKPLSLLVYLVQHSDRVVPAEELLDAVWSDTRVEEGALKTAVRLLRRALGDSAAQPLWIENTRGLGYRFRGDATPLGVQLAAADAQPGAAERALPRRDLVGREAPLQQLRSALDGEARVVLLHGPPGVGKTDTALEFAREARELGCEIHVGRTHDGDGAPPFWPWTAVLRSWFDAHGREEQGWAVREFPRLALLMPERAPWDEWPIGGAPREEPQRARFLMFDEITRFLAAASMRKPMVVVLDDLHWADEDSLALLLFMARHATGLRGLILGTHREALDIEDSPRARCLASIPREHGAESIALGGLSLGAVEQLLREKTQRDVKPALCQRVFEATRGNPLFVLELARSLAEQGTLSPLQLPARVRDAVATRLRQCSPTCARVLGAMSLEPAGASVAVLRRVLQLSGAELLDALSEAQQTGYVETHGDDYRFSHDVVRETVSAMLSASDRSLLHQTLGEAMEAIGGPDPIQLLGRTAYHFTESAALARPERALDYALRAAEAACAVYAYGEAAGLYRRALHALDFVDAPSPEQRCRLLLALGEMLGESDAPLRELRDVFLRAIDLARASNLVELWAQAAARCVHHMNMRSAFSIGVQVGLDAVGERIRRSLEAVLPKVEGQTRASAMLALCALYIAEGNTPLVCKLVEAAAEIPEVQSDPLLQGYTALNRWVVGLIDTRDGPELPDLMLDCAQRAQDIALESGAYFMHLYMALEQGDRDGVERAGRNLQTLAEQGSLTARVTAWFFSILRGSLDGGICAIQAKSDREVWAAIQETWPAPAVAAMSRLRHWGELMLRGDIEAALEPSSRYLLSRAHLPILRLFLVRLYAHCELSGPVLPELAALDENLGAVSQQVDRVFLLGLGAECCALIRSREFAKPIFRQLEPFEDRLMVGGSLLCSGIAARPLGSLAALLGQWERSERLFHSALDHAQRLRAPVLVATTELDHAAALLERGRSPDRALAQTRLRSAKRTAESLGLTALLDRARRLSTRMEQH